MGTATRVLEALRAYDLKEKGGGKYRSNSPLRPNSNSHAFSLAIHDEEHGTWQDHASPTLESGSLYDLAKILGVEITERKPVESSKRKYESLEEYAKAHGVSSEVLIKAGWSEVTQWGRPALAFKTATGTRYRFLDGEKPYYAHDEGTTKCWYGLKRALDLAKKHKQPLLIVNGEISTVVGQHYGIAALAVTSGEGAIPPDLLEQLQAANGDAEIWVGLDCDEKGRGATNAILAQLPNALPIDYMLGEGGDLADFCRLYGKEARTRLREHVVMPEIVPDAPDPEPTLAELNKQISELNRLLKNGGHTAEEEDALFDRLYRTLAMRDRKRGKIEFVSIGDLVQLNTREVSAAIREPNEVRGFSCGIKGIDKMVGGFVRGRLHVVYAATSMGKTSLTACMTGNFLPQAPGLIAATEVPAGAWLNKMVGARVGIPADNFETGMISKEKYNEVLDAYDELGEYNINFVRSGRTTTSALKTAVEIAVSEWGIEWLVVDSLSKLRTPGVHDIFETTRYAVDVLQELAIDFNLMILSTCQIGRNVKNRKNKMPQLNDGKGAGDVEENSDVVLGLYWHQYYVSRGLAKPDPELAPNTTVVTTLKHRWKAAGDKRVLLTCIDGASYKDQVDNLSLGE